MKMIFGALGAAAFASSTTLAFAATATMKEGTEIRVSNRTTLSSKTAHTGDPVDFVVDEPVTIGGSVIIPAGTPAYGVIANAEKNGHLGKSGTLDLQVNYIKVGDAKVRVRGQRGEKGNGGTGATIATTVLLGPLGLLVHGHSATVKSGTQLTVYTEQDIPVEVESLAVAEQPMVLHAVAPATKLVAVAPAPLAPAAPIAVAPANAPTPMTKGFPPTPVAVASKSSTL